VIFNHNPNLDSNKFGCPKSNLKSDLDVQLKKTRTMMPSLQKHNPFWCVQKWIMAVLFIFQKQDQSLDVINFSMDQDSIQIHIILIGKE